MQTNGNGATRDGCHESPWQEELARMPVTEYDADTVYDVLIIGAGITGVTAAYMLQAEGKRCIIAEAHNPGFGTTGGTTAHINTIAETTYKEAEAAFGHDGAQLFADAVQEGYAIIRSNVEALGISCDYEVKDGYIIATDEKQVADLQDVFEGARKVGVAVEVTEEVPTPIPFERALRLPRQAQFHPIKYLNGMLEAYMNVKGVIVEHTKVGKVEREKGIHTAHSGQRMIRAKHVIYATHTPPGVNVLSFRLAPYRSYVIAVTLKDLAYPDALIYDAQDPYHYFRTHNIDGQPLLIAGGYDHKTGHGHPDTAFNELQRYVERYYDVDRVAFRWSSQYYVPVDGLPYVGHMPGMAEGIYCATGYMGIGMTLSSVSARILSDIILGRENKYAKLFNPARVKPIAGFKDFVKENADVVYQFMAGRFSVHDIASLESIPAGTGEVVELDGRKIGVYRDEDGKFHAVNPVCTHAKCIVAWNGEERSWDCPCHGARYSIDGEVLNGPADRDLGRVEL